MIFQLDEPFMPTVSHALLRHPSFPLIVTSAKWTTPQVKSGEDFINMASEAMATAATAESPGKNAGSPSGYDIRPRAASIQIPFMGGVISPSTQADLSASLPRPHHSHHSRNRRNSLPAHHIINDR